MATTTAAKVPAGAAWSLESGQTLTAKATLTPSATTWTNVIADGAALRLGFGGLANSHAAITSSTTPTAPAAIAANANNHVTNPQWIKSVNFTAAGYKDLSKDPAAAANSWYSKNQAALTGQSLQKYKVGPWFAHVEVNLGKNAYFNSSTGIMKNVYTAEGCQTATSSGFYYSPGHVPTATTEICPALNSWGDHWSVTVRNTTSGATAQPDTIVHGNRVTKAAVLTSGSFAAHTTAVTTAYFANSLPSVATDLKDLAASKLVGTKNDTDLAYTAGVISAPTTLGTALTL